MTFYGQQFLYLSDPSGHPTEVINGARTARGLLTSMPTLFSGILANGGCDALTLEPCKRQGSIGAPVAAGSAAVNSATASVNITTTATIPAGATVIISIASNPATATTPTWTAVDAFPGNNWRTVADVASASGASTGVIGSLIVGKIQTAIPSGSTIALSGSTSPAGPVAALVTYYTGVGNWRPATTGSFAATATSTSAASGACSVGDLVVGMSAMETALVPTYDNDTLGGAWSAGTRAVTTNGVDTGNVSVVTQSKVTSVAGVQTYGVGLASSKNFATIVIALLPEEAAVSWQAVNFASTAAPWYNANNVASTEALGFLIEEFTGLDGAHHQRAIQPVGALRGGSVPGVLSHKHRTMKLNVLLHGTSERGLNYLFRWLEQQLLNCCGNDGYQQLWVRESCPILALPEEGLQMLNEVVLVEGPTWEAQPTNNSGCYLRRASFTLAAGDPCMYAVDSDVSAATMTTSGVTLTTSTATRGWWAGTDKYLAAAMPAGRVGRVGPIVTISSPLENRTGARKSIPDLVITGYAAPRNDGFATLTDAYPIGEIVIAGAASAGLVIEVNVPGRQVRYRDPYGDNQWYDGSRFIGPSSVNARRWWAIDNCVPGGVIVQPMWAGLACRYDSNADPVSQWTVDVNAVEINGCC